VHEIALQLQDLLCQAVNYNGHFLQLLHVACLALEGSTSWPETFSCCGLRAVWGLFGRRWDIGGYVDVDLLRKGEVDGMLDGWFCLQEGGFFVGVDLALFL
jgi:hypothetical protein